jgi:hypothetical protein
MVKAAGAWDLGEFALLAVLVVMLDHDVCCYLDCMSRLMTIMQPLSHNKYSLTGMEGYHVKGVPKGWYDALEIVTLLVALISLDVRIILHLSCQLLATYGQ